MNDKLRDNMRIKQQWNEFLDECQLTLSAVRIKFNYNPKEEKKEEKNGKGKR